MLKPPAQRRLAAPLKEVSVSTNTMSRYRPSFVRREEASSRSDPTKRSSLGQIRDEDGHDDDADGDDDEVRMMMMMMILTCCRGMSIHC